MSYAIEVAIENDWVNGKFEETETDYKISNTNILYKNEIEFLPKGVELICKKLKPKSVLEFGFGMGWTATEFQKQSVQRHVILEPNKDNYYMALEWKKQFDDNDIEILNIFSWDLEITEKFDLVYDDRQQFTKKCDKKHYKQMNKILKEGQWYSRNACIVTKTHVEAMEGDQIYYTLNNTRYIQGLRRWQHIL